LHRIHALFALLTVLALVAACGNEPPTPGELQVTSLPAGATVLLDGVATGLETPAVIDELDGGTYTVSVDLAGVEFRPAERTVDVFYGSRSTSHFQTDAGIVTVTSAPPGASIIIDGIDTGEVTPHRFTSIDPGPHQVDLRLTHHRTSGGAQEIDAEAGVELDVEFELALATVVMFEGFSNVRCVGCPAFIANVQEVQHDRGYGPDRMVYVKYPGPVPYPLDPMYRNARAMVDTRMLYYSGQPSFAHPTLYLDGSLVGGWGTPIDADAMAAAIDAGHASPADFYLDVATTNLHDLEQSTVTVEVSVVAPYANVDLSEYSLRAVLVYEEVTTAEEYEPGGDEYHWVARADAEAAAGIGAVTQGIPLTFTVELADPDPSAFDLTPHGREVVVFAQHVSDKSIIQAGSSMISEAAAPSPVPSGGSR